MKWNLPLIIAVFVLPLMIYTILLTKQSTVDIATASTIKPKKVMITSPMCGECIKTKKEVEKIRPKYENLITIEVLEATTELAKPYIDKYNVNLVQTTFFLKKDGKIHKKIEGGMSESMLEKQLKEIQ